MLWTSRKRWIISCYYPKLTHPISIQVETDIPTTSIRSKKDVINNEQKATLSTNDIVINKLTQILSYLRAGTRYFKHLMPWH